MIGMRRASTGHHGGVSDSGWILPDAQRVPTHKKNTGRAGTMVDLLLLHYAVDPEQTKVWDALDVARGFARKDERTASAHLVVGRDGSAVQCVSLDDTAWHGATGRKGVPSRFPRHGEGTIKNTPGVAGWVNRRSVGIELCNVGWAVDKLKVSPEHIEAGLRHRNPRSKSTRWESYRAAQISTLREIIERIVVTVPTLRFVCGHEDVSHYDVTGKGSKLDPGPAFPWHAIDWQAFGLRRIVYDFGARAWVEHGDEVTKPFDVVGLRN